MSTPDPLPRRSGVNHIDLIVGLCAILISAVSLFIAEKSNRTQERMLAASVWPYLSWDTSNYNDHTQRDEVSLEIANNGVGPARVETLEVSYQGKPLANARELVEACCAQQVQSLHNWKTRTSTINPVVIPAHDSVLFFGIDKTDDNAALWEVFNHERFKLQARVCYCSVLGDCWLLRTGVAEPEAVKACVAQGIQYR